MEPLRQQSLSRIQSLELLSFSSLTEQICLLWAANQVEAFAVLAQGPGEEAPSLQGLLQLTGASPSRWLQAVDILGSSFPQNSEDQSVQDGFARWLEIKKGGLGAPFCPGSLFDFKAPVLLTLGSPERCPLNRNMSHLTKQRPLAPRAQREGCVLPG